MSNAFFPSLPGLAWDVVWAPRGSTRVVKHVSGREVRVSLFAYPLYDIELTYEVLRAASADLDLQTLEGFFLARLEQYDTFLLNKTSVTHDPADSTITGGVLDSSANGTDTEFTFQRGIGVDYSMPVDWVTGCTAVYLNGTALASSGWSIVAPNMVQLSSAPAEGTVVTADYTFAYRVRFAEDNLSFKNLMYQLWDCQTVKLQTVKP